jgi:DNA-binding CsgD family transcriptional regulator
VDSSLANPDQAPAASRLVGRLDELAEIDRFLDAARTGLHALLLSGQAGIGKTSLWKAAVGRATERGFRVLVCRPNEVETHLSFAALVDLLDELADEVLPRLPEPQRQALGAALLRVSPGAVPAPLGVSLGVLAAIRAASEAAPVLIAVDDVPWLDASSVAALEFALRRLEDSPVGLLAAQRTDGTAGAIPALVASIPPDRFTAIDVGALSVDDLARIVAHVLRVDLRRPTLVRIHELSAGNAFYALELARAVERRGSRIRGDDLPLPDRLEALIHDRINTLPPASAEVALYAAALSPPTRAALDAALGPEAVRSAIAAGANAGIFESEDGPIRFSHPLLAAAVYGRASAESRREVHRKLAEVVAEPEERARHLALAADEPDADVAAALEEAAGIARARGAAAAAAELADSAVRLTPAGDENARRRRAMGAAEHYVAAGDVPLARSSLEQLLTETGPDDRGPVLAQLGQILIFVGEMAAARRAFTEALPLAGRDLGLRTRIEMGLAGIAFLTGEDEATGARQIAAALADAEQLGDAALLLQAIGHFATWQFVLGRGLSPDLIHRADALERWRPDVIVVEHPDLQFARILRQLGDTGSARLRCERLLVDARQRGDWSSLPYVLDELTVIELTTGNWDLAQQYSDDSRTAAVQAAQEQSIIDGGVSRARLLALRGDELACRAAVATYLESSDNIGLPFVRRGLLTILGLLELSLGDAAAAFDQLEQALRISVSLEDEPTLLRPTIPLAVEALIGLGRLDEAAALLDPYARLARRRRRTVCIGDADMCRALLLAARLDLDAALETAAKAIRAFESLGLPFELARALLARGEILRRARKKAAAAASIGESLAIFERLGARSWTKRARDELGRSEHRRTPSGGLTETQLRVAELAAAGSTNREIADALFMSVHTVEAHLTRIYRTLGVQTRTELARHRFDGTTPDIRSPHPGEM